MSAMSYPFLSAEESADFQRDYPVLANAILNYTKNDVIYDELNCKTAPFETACYFAAEHTQNSEMSALGAISECFGFDRYHYDARTLHIVFLRNLYNIIEPIRESNYNRKAVLALANRYPEREEIIEAFKFQYPCSICIGTCWHDVPQPYSAASQYFMTQLKELDMVRTQTRVAKFKHELVSYVCLHVRSQN
jgi:hypothetical protein